MSKGKDPAFLFYSKDFYEGTRLMTPEERACYVDLLVYQHQHKIIPKDLSRMYQYCAGCSDQVVNQVVNEKFVLVEGGYINERLNDEIEKRSKAKPMRIASGTLAGLISSHKLTKPCKQYIKDGFDISEFVEFDEDEIRKEVKEWFTKRLTKWLTINVNVNEDVDNNKIDISKKFYTEEMESNKKAEQYELYVKFITYLFKNNPTKKPCNWLNLEHQVTYKQFTNLLKLAGSLENLFDKVDIGINKPSYLTGKKVMHTTLKNWMK